MSHATKLSPGIMTSPSKFTGGIPTGILGWRPVEYSLFRLGGAQTASLRADSDMPHLLPLQGEG